MYLTLIFHALSQTVGAPHVVEVNPRIGRTGRLVAHHEIHSLGKTELRQIGRASCRERVCLYV